MEILDREEESDYDEIDCSTLLARTLKNQSHFCSQEGLVRTTTRFILCVSIPTPCFPSGKATQKDESPQEAWTSLKRIVQYLFRGGGTLRNCNLLSLPHVFRWKNRLPHKPIIIMSVVDWYLEYYKANTKAVLHGGDLPGIVDIMASLKLGRNISSIEFIAPYDRCSVDNTKKVCDSLAELLKANPGIKSLSVRTNRGYDRQTREYLLQVLADGIAGDSLEYLWLDDQSGEISVEETAFLVRYLTRNRNLTRLRFDVTGDPGVQLVSCLPNSLMNLCLDVWQYRGMGELSAAIGRCSSIQSLRIVVYEGEHLTEVESFFRSIDQMHRLTRLEIEFQFAIPAEVLDALRDFVAQQVTLAHFAVDARYGHGARYVESWKGLGLALCSVKSVSLRVGSQVRLRAVLPQLQSCECLALLIYLGGAETRPTLEVASRLPNLRNVAIDACYSRIIEHEILDLIKSSHSIGNVRIDRGRTVSAAFQGSVESFCILNRVFGTDLVSFASTDLWTRILSKVSDGSARATLLYRLLREKPEMIIRRNPIRFNN